MEEQRNSRVKKMRNDAVNEECEEKSATHHHTLVCFGFNTVVTHYLKPTSTIGVKNMGLVEQLNPSWDDALLLRKQVPVLILM